MDKANLRRSLLKVRQILPKTEWQEKSDRIRTHLQSSPIFKEAKTVLAYFSFRQEPDLKPLFADNSRRWGFPRCVGKELSWHFWQAGDQLETNKFGILEPLANAPTLDPSQVDLILVPSVACDVRGYRLGYGAGYYDRLLTLPEWSNKLTIGVVFEFTYLVEIPSDQWDRSLTGVCTETGLKIINKHLGEQINNVG
ncbi:MAG: 5-formyltetrahydrofolate cyclo-ligase [Phormidium sp.]